MKHPKQHIEPCRLFAKSAVRLSELPGQHPDRVAWEAHAVTCAACRSFLWTDLVLGDAIRRLPDPKPIQVKAAVMAQIKNRPSMPLLRLRDIYWGASAGFVGIFLGLLLVRADSQSFSATKIHSNGEDVASIAVVDDFDAYIADFSSNGDN